MPHAAPHYEWLECTRRACICPEHHFITAHASSIKAWTPAALSHHLHSMSGRDDWEQVARAGELRGRDVMVFTRADVVAAGVADVGADVDGFLRMLITLRDMFTRPIAHLVARRAGSPNDATRNWALAQTLLLVALDRLEGRTPPSGAGAGAPAELFMGCPQKKTCSCIGGNVCAAQSAVVATWPPALLASEVHARTGRDDWRTWVLQNNVGGASVVANISELRVRWGLYLIEDELMALLVVLCDAFVKPLATALPNMFDGHCGVSRIWRRARELITATLAARIPYARLY